MEALDQGVVKGSVVGAELAAPDEVPTLVVYRNVWSEPACKSVFAKTTSGLSPLVGTYSDVLCYGETEDFEPGDFLDMKLQQSGAVTLTGKIHGCTVSGSSVLIGETFTCLGWTLVGKRQVVAAGRWEALLVVDFPPKASKGFVGYSRCLSLVFEYDGSVRLTVR